MTRNRSFRILFALILAAILVVPAAVVEAAGTGPSVPPPIGIRGPRLSPPAVRKTDVPNAPQWYYMIYNNQLVPPGLPAPSIEANIVDGGRTQEKPGRGIRQTATSTGYGLTLYTSPNVCNDFNDYTQWSASPPDVKTSGRYPQLAYKSDIATDWFAGWGPFAIDDGAFYRAKDVVFTREQSVGPGTNYVNKNNNSVKIASSLPYAAGFGSPRIPVPDGYAWGKVMVSVKYLIWDHDQAGKEGGPDGLDYDWASMGVKAGADSNMAVYVNGYVRGEWAELTNTVDLGDANDIMVLIQGQSPGAFNSNIYFDDVQIAFIDKDGNGKYLKDCRYDGAVK